MRSGKAHSTLPSAVMLSCPATEASPLTLMTVGAHHCVMVVINKPNDALANDMYA